MNWRRRSTFLHAAPFHFALPVVISTSLAAFEIHDDNHSFTRMLYFQVRAETAWLENADGEPYNTTRAADGYPDDVQV